MPHVLFFENGFAPTTRTIREIGTMQRAGWDVTFAHMPSMADEVAKLGVRSFLVEQPSTNLYHERLAAQLVDLNAQLKELTGRVNGLAARYQQERGTVTARFQRQRAKLTRRIEKLAKLARGGRTLLPRWAGRASRARVELEAAKAARTTLAQDYRSAGAGTREELEAAKAQRIALAAEIRAIHAARRTPTPLTAGTHFGDLGRLEAVWHVAAQELATVKADLFWCADLDGLPAMVWAREAAQGQPPLVLDCHEMWSELEYMPELYQVGWRMLMDRFLDKPDAVFAVSQPILDALVAEHGARRPLLVPNLATPGEASPDTVRDRLGLPVKTPLVIHVGNVTRGRDPRYDLVVDMLKDLPDAHFAYVGSRQKGLDEEIMAAAGAVGVTPRLHLVDPVPLEHLRGFLATADVSLFMYDPTRSLDNRYAMPFKLYDSLSSGVPVVAPDGGIAADFVETEGLGGRFTLDRPGSLAGAVRALLADRTAQQRARQRSHEFTWAAIEPAMLSLVDEVLQEHHAAAAMSR